MESAISAGGNSWSDVGQFAVGGAEIGLGATGVYTGVSAVANPFTTSGSFANAVTSPGSRLASSPAISTAGGIAVAADIGFATLESNSWLDNIDALENITDDIGDLADQALDIYADALGSYSECCD